MTPGATAVVLSDRDRALLDGKGGPAARIAAGVVVRMAEVSGATRLMDISAAHIDSSIYLGDATLEFAERLADAGGRVAVPSTLNVSGLDEHHWRDSAVPPEWAAKAHRQMVAYQRMGCVTTWTCAPYQTRHKPVFGQQIAWGESNAICFANSVIGARTERYPDLFDICAAITGRVPEAGLHLEENRGGQDLFRLVDVPRAWQEDDTFYPVLGHLIGKIAGDRIPVVVGLEAQPTEDQLKALCAASASSGAVALLHLVGVTPEAPTLAAALRGKGAERTFAIGREELRAARRELSTSAGERLDLVVLGSPHFSVAEFRALAPLLKGRRRHPGTGLVVTTSRIMAALAKDDGLLDALESFGGTVTVDTCVLATPMLRPEVKVLMTNSAKYAYYSPGLLGTTVAFGSLAECVESAVAGRVARDEAPWSD
ncbi:MAG: aconitase X catalytic domain-containing protein [Gemmatimonadales bacterium]|nr:aconitase X catalytic domain-containing protein [Gemmatimonadales bacterium]